MNFIDSHAHLSDDPLFDHRAAILERAKQAQVSQIININTSVSLLERGLEAFAEYPWVFHAGATHPHDAEEKGEKEFEFFAKYAREKKIIAIGETGLDYTYLHSPKEIQQKLFNRYLILAHEVKLPVIIHCRDAFDDFFSIVDAFKHPIRGVLHCFTGTLEEARKALERGWFISFSGIVTFKKNDTLRAIAKEVPIDRLLIETDAPFLAPQSHRGKTNEPSYLKETAQVIADVKDISLEALAAATVANTLKLFLHRISD